MNDAQEREIDLIDLLWRAAMGWRVLLVFLLIGVVGVSALLYVQGASSYTQQTELKEVDLDELEEDMSEQAIDAVNTMISSYNTWYYNKQYVEQTPFAKVDTSALEQLQQEWIVETSSNGLSPTSLATIYRSVLRSREAFDFYAEQITMDVDTKYIQDMLYIEIAEAQSDADDTVLTVSFILLDGMDADQVADVLEDYIRNYAPEQIDVSSGYSLELISTMQMISSYSATITSNISSRKTQNTTLRETIDTTLEGFDEDQILLYEIQTGDVYLGEDADGTDASELTKPSLLSIRNIAIGLFFGVAAYGGMLFLLVMFAPAILSSSEVTGMPWDLYLLDEVHKRSYSGGWQRLFYDRHIYRVRYRKQQKTMKKSLSHVTTQMTGLAENAGCRSVLLLPLGDEFYYDSNSRRYCEELQNEWHNPHMAIHLAEQGDIREQMLSLRTDVGITLLIEIGETRRVMFAEVMNAAARRGVPVLGCVVLEL